MKIGNKVRILTRTKHYNQEGIIIGTAKGAANWYTVELNDCALSNMDESFLEHIPLFNVGDIVVLKNIEAIHPDNRNQRGKIERVEGKNQYWQNDEFEYTITVQPEGKPSYYIQIEETHMDLYANLAPDQEIKCTCDIMALMAVGCKCGQIERERERAKHVPA